ncbi:MAG: hypothetical protein LBF24_04135, partial [Puniceicoccales bacterium]|nr:hypothetical protein [Puniceicoccales bacterium]
MPAITLAANSNSPLSPPYNPQSISTEHIISHRLNISRSPAAAFSRKRSPISCPIDRSDASSQEFWEELRAIYQSGEPLAKVEGDRLRVVLLLHKEWMGETAAAGRLLEEFGRRGHDCCICDQPNRWLLKRINPSFVLCLCAFDAPPEGVPSGAVFSRPHEIAPCVSPEQILRYENIFHCPPNIQKLQQLAAQKGKILHTAPFQYSVSRTKFSENLKRRLFYGGMCHDPRRGKLYAKLYRLLDGTNYFDVYGPASIWSRRTPMSYRGFVRWDGGALLDVMRSAGISLVLHSDDHLTGATVSPRIFEAAAASNVIISDRHSFVLEHFGDSVLYVDQE